MNVLHFKGVNNIHHDADKKLCYIALGYFQHAKFLLHYGLPMTCVNKYLNVMTTCFFVLFLCFTCA